ncbi:MAG: cobalt transporter CbiM [Armatimonadota bacterium]
MHIPDGSIGPQTYIAAFAAVAPFWVTASRKLNKTLRSRHVPRLALGAAFSFVIMMFNIPILGGTTGHAVGAVMTAVLLGPWAACVAITIALIAQAVAFGDGGVTCIGANSFNMAVVMPFVGYGVYRLIAGNSDIKSYRHWLGAAIGGYAGLNASAITTAVMLGIQPLIASDAGKALYFPYPLKVTIPVMSIEHLLIFGFVEAVITGMVISYMQKTDSSMLHLSNRRKDTERAAS